MFYFCENVKFCVKTTNSKLEIHFWSKWQIRAIWPIFNLQALFEIAFYLFDPFAIDHFRALIFNQADLRFLRSANNDNKKQFRKQLAIPWFIFTWNENWNWRSSTSENLNDVFVFSLFWRSPGCNWTGSESRGMPVYSVMTFDVTPEIRLLFR